MKNVIRLIAVALVVVMTVSALASCGVTLSGTYEAKADLAVAGGSTSYKFSGSKYTMTTTTSVLGTSTTTEQKGSYKIEKKTETNSNGDKTTTMTITFTWKDDDGKEQSTTLPFSQNKEDKTITIGIVTLTKK